MMLPAPDLPETQFQAGLVLYDRVDSPTTHVTVLAMAALAS